MHLFPNEGRWKVVKIGVFRTHLVLSDLQERTATSFKMTDGAYDLIGMTTIFALW